MGKDERGRAKHEREFYRREELRRRKAGADRISIAHRSEVDRRPSAAGGPSIAKSGQ